MYWLQLGETITDLSDVRTFQFVEEGEEGHPAPTVIATFRDGATYRIHGDDAERFWLCLERSCGTRRWPLIDGAPGNPGASRPIPSRAERDRGSV